MFLTGSCRRMFLIGSSSGERLAGNGLHFTRGYGRLIINANYRVFLVGGGGWFLVLGRRNLIFFGDKWRRLASRCFGSPLSYDSFILRGDSSISSRGMRLFPL